MNTMTMDEIVVLTIADAMHLATSEHTLDVQKRLLMIARATPLSERICNEEADHLTDMYDLGHVWAEKQHMFCDALRRPPEKRAHLPILRRARCGLSKLDKRLKDMNLGFLARNMDLAYVGLVEKDVRHAVRSDITYHHVRLYHEACHYEDAIRLSVLAA